MTNQFDSKGGEQNVGQGDHTIGKQENVTQEVRGDGCISSGTGNVTVNNHGGSLKPKTVIIASVLTAAVFGGGLAAWHWLAPLPVKNTISIKGNNSGTAIVAGGNVTVNNPNAPPELLAQYAKELGATEQVVNGFFGTLLQEKVPRDQWDSKLREIATQYKELLARVGDDQAAKQAIEAGDYAKAEALLEDAANQHSLAAAETYAQLASLQEVQLRYAKAAAYWQKAAALLPDDKKKDRAYYLNEAGYDLRRLARSVEAKPLYEQSLSLYRELGDKAGEGVTLSNIGALHHAKGDYPAALKHLEKSLRIMQEVGNKAGEGVTLNNISQIYHARSDYAAALKYLEQSLRITQEIGDKAVEGATLNNISMIYKAWGDYATALKHLEQSLRITQEIGDKAGEGTTLNNIGQIYKAWGDYAAALKYLEQSLRITQEIGDKAVEAVTSWNIGMLYKKRGDLRKAEQYMSRTVQLDEEIGRPELKWEREALEDIRAKLRGK